MTRELLGMILHLKSTASYRIQRLRQGRASELSLVVQGKKVYFTLARFGLAVRIIQRPQNKLVFIAIPVSSKAERLHYRIFNRFFQFFMMGLEKIPSISLSVKIIFITLDHQVALLSA